MSQIQIGKAKYLALYFLQNDHDVEEREKLIGNLTKLYTDYTIKASTDFEDVALEIQAIRQKSQRIEDEEHKLEFLDDWIVEKCIRI